MWCGRSLPSSARARRRRSPPRSPARGSRSRVGPSASWRSALVRRPSGGRMGVAATGFESRRAGTTAGEADTTDLLLVHGDDRFRVDLQVRRWRGAIGAEMGVEVVDAPAPIERIRSTIAEAPFIDPSRYLLIRDPPQLTGGRRADESGRALAAALELRAPTTSVCLVCHETVPTSHPVLAAVTRLGGQVLVRRQLRGRDLRAWADGAAAERGVRLRSGGLEHILRVAGS